MPRYVTIDLFGKVGVGKTTIFELFAGDRLLKYGGNLSYDFRGYYAKCWVLPRRWTHSMVFLADPKLEWRWRDLKVKHLRKLFEPTNILMIVTDSTEEDVDNIKKSFSIYPKIKRKLIIFVIANMQDKKDHMNVEQIKERLGMRHVLGLNATSEGAKKKLEPFLEEAAMLYFRMLSKRGQALELLDEDEIGFNKKVKSKKRHKTKYGSKISSLKEQRVEREEKLERQRQEDLEKRMEAIEENRKKLKNMTKKEN